MRLSLFLAAVLSFPCLVLVGCGSSSPTNATTEPSTESLSPAAIAKAEEEMKKVEDEERAYQKSQTPAGKSR